MESEKELVDRARRGAGRAVQELDREGRDLAQPCPRVAPDVLAEGRNAVERTAAALQQVIDGLDARF